MQPPSAQTCNSTLTRATTQTHQTHPAIHRNHQNTLFPPRKDSAVEYRLFFSRLRIPKPPVRQFKHPEDPAARQLTESIAATLLVHHKEPLDARKKVYKDLQMTNHPDKHKDEAELYTAVFQFLQGEKEWFLKES